MRMKSHLFAALLTLICATAWADQNMHYQQKTLPNGDTVTTFSSSDGSSAITIQHADGTIETTTTSPDGTKSVMKQNKDGSIETQVTEPKGKPM